MATPGELILQFEEVVGAIIGTVAGNRTHPQRWDSYSHSIFVSILSAASTSEVAVGRDLPSWRESGARAEEGKEKLSEAAGGKAESKAESDV